MPNTKTVVSKRWTVQARDFINGLWFAIASAIADSLYNLIASFVAAGKLTFDIITLEGTAVIGIGAGVLYIFRQLVAPNKVVIVNPDEKDMESLQNGKDVVISK